MDGVEIDKELLKGHVDTIILSLLNEQDRYGYEIAKTIRQTSDEQFELKEATLYLSLKRLEKKGFVKSYWSDEAAGGGRRKYYTLTTEGEILLAKKRREWRFLKQLLPKFLEEGDGALE